MKLSKNEKDYLECLVHPAYLDRWGMKQAQLTSLYECGFIEPYEGRLTSLGKKTMNSLIKKGLIDKEWYPTRLTLEGEKVARSLK